MTIKYTNIFHCKALQNLPKLGFFGLKIHHLATLFETIPTYIQEPKRDTRNALQIGTEPSDNQYLVVDIGLAAVPIIMIGNCGPHDTLVRQKPSRDRF
jgi:hypothetical protein